MKVVLNKNILFCKEEGCSYTDIQHEVSNHLNLPKEDFYLEQNGRILHTELLPDSSKDVKVVLRLRGGKGGFGSMLRAIGAQIEKTTNREACRDLSGRRLRDINQEQRLKDWLATKAEREKEAAARKKKKLEKMCEVPKHEFKDDAYFKELSEIPERVENAVLQGLEVISSSKRPAEINDTKQNKKKKLWIDADMEELSSSDEESDSDVDKGKIENCDSEKAESCDFEKAGKSDSEKAEICESENAESCDSERAGKSDSKKAEICELENAENAESCDSEKAESCDSDKAESCGSEKAESCDSEKSELNQVEDKAVTV